MRPSPLLTRDIVLVGGGHTHALVLRKWGMRPLPSARLTLINPGPTAPYSGMLPGHIAGHYPRDALEIDLVRLARFAGARLILGAAEALDPDRREIVVGARRIGYDIASIDIGVTSQMPDLPGFAEHAVPAKPLEGLARRWQAFLDAAEAGHSAPQAAVIGGGVAGLELSMAMAHALRARGCTPQVTVIEAAAELPSPGRAGPRLRAALDRQGVTLRLGAPASEVTAQGVVLQTGETVPACFVAGAAGARPQGWLARTGLPTEDGYLRVGPDLRVEGRDDIFAAGDCAHLVHAPRPKAGVYAVRAAPVLHDNLRAAATGRARRAYRPQRDYLKLISLGEKAALAEKAGVAVEGRLLWRLKDRIDRKFMQKLRDLPEMTAEPAAEAAEPAEPLCAGCGSKLAPGALARATSALPAPLRDDVLSTPGDDAAVLRVGGARQVITTDHLRAFTEDPALLARIAAIHAMGDIWAMGARPQAALATVILPRMSERLQARTLDEILEAASTAFREAGAELAGGHSTMGAEMTLGFTVTGLTEGDPVTLAGARPGDALILTRPIGSGTLLAAEMRLRARGSDMEALWQAMATPQAEAAALLRDAHAMTDVTGFGLAGHLMAICTASGVGAEIDPEAIPLYPGAETLADQGIRSTIWEQNRAHAPVTGATGARGALLHDPQTSGGFLAALPEPEAAHLLPRLAAAGAPAHRIGRIVAAPPAVACVPGSAG
ncbi:selenide, water dikinase SelD [Rhodosalinus halophilus]|uniref:Selenide, water dikinase SelD n=2 Tax=Rhodosalinus halophilus TaxID=2259333 RepID=A0A365UCQ1_9RHOB|nr:selenide, water dikinase SelD [Rhodosalinus halophilus]RBI86808.1 selenide, water dikinase SelD [Rhodosalinus halophilus]